MLYRRTVQSFDIMVITRNSGANMDRAAFSGWLWLALFFGSPIVAGLVLGFML